MTLFTSTKNVQNEPSVRSQSATSFYKQKMLINIFILLFVTVGLTVAGLNEIVDLTWDFSNETIYWPGTRPFEWTKIIADSSAGYWYAENEFCAGEHGGTHFDAPYHFYKEGWKVSEVPINRLVAKGACIDLSHKNTGVLSKRHLEDWVRKNGPFSKNTVLLIKFGWSKYWSNKTAYLGLDADGNKEFPGISEEAATWIVNSGKIVGVGLDTASLDPGSSTDLPAHQILCKNQIYGIENVKLLIDLPARGFTLIVLPMKLKGGTAAPVRLLAVPKRFFVNL